jgi:hypothetical protein
MDMNLVVVHQQGDHITRPPWIRTVGVEPKMDATGQSSLVEVPEGCPHLVAAMLEVTGRTRHVPATPARLDGCRGIDIARGRPSERLSRGVGIDRPGAERGGLLMLIVATEAVCPAKG